MPRSRKLLGKLVSAEVCLFGSRLFLHIARATHSFPKTVHSELSLTINVPQKTLFKKMLLAQLRLLLNLFLWVDFFFMHNVPIQPSGYLKKDSEKLER